MTKRVLILVEGQTEERFTKDVLAPAFWNKNLFFNPTILVTKRVKKGSNFKGGVTNFAKFRNDAQRLLNCAAGALVTTMLDYYGLPSDFPGMNTRPSNGTPLERVLHVETAVAQHFGAPVNFLPFLALHEFEAWLFSSPAEIHRAMNEPERSAEVEAIRAAVSTPEEINERPEFAPSKQLRTIFPAYKKTVHGPTITARIGLEQIRGQCPHFHDWLSKLEAFAAY
jgi:Domain of unknown function (DUF4276)